MAAPRRIVTAPFTAQARYRDGVEVALPVGAILTSVALTGGGYVAGYRGTALHFIDPGVIRDRTRPYSWPEGR